MTVNQIIAVLVIMFGLNTSFHRLRGNDQKFKKLSAMREQWGHKTGGAVHAVAYCGLPIVLGLVLLAS